MEGEDKRQEGKYHARGAGVTGRALSRFNLKPLSRFPRTLGMTFKSAIWRPIALVLSGLNLVGVGFAAGAAEAWHAGVHATLALAFWSWSQRLRERAAGSGAELPRLEALELEVNQVRRELEEAQERLDFTERLLAQGRQEPARPGSAPPPR